jgi:CubicO group peptidase (beta-lactamase class C family)
VFALQPTLDAGKPNKAMVASRCSTDRLLDADAIFQAASLTKPLIAFFALKLARDGMTDLDAPVSRYLPDGYAHHQNSFGDPDSPKFDLVPASTLARIPVVTLLKHSSGLPNWTSGLLAPEFEPGSRW